MSDGEQECFFNTLLSSDLIIAIFQAYLPRQHSLEVFSDIEDEGSIDETSGSPPALLLAAVCREWRQIALSTPQIWNIISFDLIRYRKNRPYHVKIPTILAEWLKRAGQAPLYFRLAYHPKYATSIQIRDHDLPFEPRWDSECLRPIFVCLQPHLPKVRVLDLQVLPDLFKWLAASLALRKWLDFSLRESFHQLELESLNIRPSDYTWGQPSKFSDLSFLGPDSSKPRLVRLLISNFNFESLKARANVEQLSFFNGDFLHQNEYLYLLQHAPQLKFCHVSHISPTDNPSLPNSTSFPFLIMNALQTLDVTQWTLQHNCFAAPELVQLTSGCFEIESDQKRSLLQFLNTSSSGLTKFTVRLVDDEVLIQLLVLTPNLRGLEVEMSGRSDGSLFRRLAEKLESGLNSSIFLPELETLSWRGQMNFSWNLVLSALPTPEPKHIPRRPLSSLHFSAALCWKGEDDEDDESFEPELDTLYLDEENLQAFIALARSGFKISLKSLSEPWASLSDILFMSCQMHAITDHPFVLEYSPKEWSSDDSEEDQGSMDEDDQTTNELFGRPSRTRMRSRSVSPGASGVGLEFLGHDIPWLESMPLDVDSDDYQVYDEGTEVEEVESDSQEVSEE